VPLARDDVEVIKQETEGYAVESDGSVTVVLATSLSQSLVDEGFARELISKIQNMRKATGLEVTDRINVTLKSSEAIRKAVDKHDELIRHETLAEEVLFEEGSPPEGFKEWNVNGEKTAISVVKI